MIHTRTLIAASLALAPSVQSQTLESVLGTPPAGAGIGFSSAFDGETAVVSQILPSLGRSVCLYERTGSAWNLALCHTPPHPNNTTRLALEDDVVVAGGSFHEVLIFERLASGWALTQTLPNPTGVNIDQFGDGLAILQDSLFISSSAEDNGVVREYRKLAGSWTLHSVMQPQPGFRFFGSTLVQTGSELGVLATNAASVQSKTLISYAWNSQGSLQAGPRVDLSASWLGSNIYEGVGLVEFEGLGTYVVWNDLAGDLWLQALGTGAPWTLSVQPAQLQAEGVASANFTDQGALVGYTTASSPVSAREYLMLSPSSSAVAGARLPQCIRAQGSGGRVLILPIPSAPEIWLAPLGLQWCPSEINSLSENGHLTAAGTTSSTQAETELRLSGLPPGSVGVLVEASGMFNPNLSPGMVAALCVGPPYSRLAIYTAGQNGRASIAPAQVGAFLPGTTRAFIGWYRDGAAPRLTNSLTLEPIQ